MVMNAQWGQNTQWFTDSKTQNYILRTQNRKDSAEQIARENIQRNARLIQDALSARGYHSDSVSKGLFLARELEHIQQQVLRTPRPEMSALDLFDLDTSVRPGAERFTVRRVEGTGRAEYFDGAGSNNMPASNVFREEESWPLHHIAAGYQWSLFDSLSADFAGFSLIDELRDATVYAINEFINSKAWTGDVNRQALGVLNQPYVPKATFGLTIGDSADPEDIAQEVLRLARYASARTEGVFKPNRVITSIRLADYLSERELGQFKTASIKERILDKSNYLQDIIGVPELAGAGPGGTDVMLFDYGPDRRKGFSNVLAQTPTFLPVQQVGLKFMVPCYATYGGVKTEQPLNSLIAYCTLDTGFEGVY